MKEVLIEATFCHLHTDKLLESYILYIHYLRTNCCSIRDVGKGKGPIEIYVYKINVKC